MIDTKQDMKLTRNWKPQNASRAFQEMRTKAVQDLRERDLKRGVPMVREDDGTLSPGSLMEPGEDGMLVVNRHASKTVHTPRELEVLLAHRWRQFRAEPRNEAEFEERWLREDNERHLTDIGDEAKAIEATLSVGAATVRQEQETPDLTGDDIEATLTDEALDADEQATGADTKAASDHAAAQSQVCGVCGRRLRSAKSLRNHMKAHNKKG